MTAPIDALADAASPLAGRILRIIADNPGIRGSAIADKLWADAEDGGPTSWATNVKVTIHNANRKWCKMGWHVRGKVGSGGYHILHLGVV